MDDKTINRSLYTSIALCVLCLLLLIVALLFQWVEIAIAMALLSLVQAYLICVWLHRKRNARRHKRTQHYQRKP